MVGIKLLTYIGEYIPLVFPKVFVFDYAIILKVRTHYFLIDCRKGIIKLVFFIQPYFADETKLIHGYQFDIFNFFWTRLLNEQLQF